MQAWLENAAGITASELIRMCKKDVDRVREEARYSGVVQHHADYIQEKELVGFKEALAFALEQLLQEMSFLGPELAHSTRLTNEICTVPSVGGEPAVSIVLDIDLPEILEGRGRDRRHASISSSSSASCEPVMPSVFTYSPKRLYDVSQSLFRTSMEDFREQTAIELDQLLASRSKRNAFYPNPRSRLPHANSVALVSSFSLDTISLAPSTKSSRSRRIASKVASCWTAVREGTRGLPVKLTRGRRRRASAFAPSPSSVAAISVLPGSRSLVDLRKPKTSDDPSLPPVPPLPPTLVSDGKYREGASSRHPYLHLNLPSPLILANHHSDRRGSDATVISSDAELC